MLRIKNNKLFFSALFFLILFICGPVLSQGLEVEYPTIPGAPLPEKPLLPEYIRYIYNFSIIIAGLIAFFSFIYGGFRYLLSVGQPTAMADAKDQITAGIVGLIILLGSYLLLTTINPQLAFFELERPPIGVGVILYDAPGCPGGTNPTGREGKDFIYVGKSSSNFSDFSNKARSIYFLNPSEDTLGVKVYIFPRVKWEPKDSPSWSSESHNIGDCRGIPAGVQSQSIYLKWEREAMPDITDTTEWYEIPIGTLVENVLEESRLNRIKQLVAEAENKSRVVKNKAEELHNELLKCDCKHTDPDPDKCEVPGRKYCLLVDCDNDPCLDYCGVDPCPGWAPQDIVCKGDPCPNRDEINQKRRELRGAYLDFEGWLAQGELYALVAQLKKDAARLRIAQILLAEGNLPLHYDNWTEFRDAAEESGGEVTRKPLEILNEIIEGKGDSATFYFDKEGNEDILEELMFYLGAEIGMLDTIGTQPWGDIQLPIPSGTEILAWPTSGCITQWFDTYRAIYVTGCHYGVDIANSVGTHIIAAADGKVHFIEPDDSLYYGIYVTLEHQYGGFTFYTLYSHLSQPAPGLKIGDNVSQGQLVGYMDSTGFSGGNHLHFSLLTGLSYLPLEDGNMNPKGVFYDPELYLPSGFPACGDDSLRRPDLCTTPIPPFAGSLGENGCEVTNLEPVFSEYATAASCICNQESGGQADLLNDDCLSSVTCDYSVGLFQINQLPRCPGGFDWGCNAATWCNIVNQAVVNACVTTYMDPLNNMQKAWQLFESSSYTWGGHWFYAARNCGLP